MRLAGVLLFVSIGAVTAATRPAIAEDDIPVDVSCEPIGDVSGPLPDGVSLPTATSTAEPVYPEELRRDRVEGKIALRAVICSDGVPRRFELVWENPEGFREAALAAVRQWRYEPARLEGRPVAVRYAIVLRFRLTDDPPDDVETTTVPDPIGAAGLDVTLPVLKSRVQPRIPAESRLRRESGRVVLQGRIEKDGTVGPMTTLEATNYAFERAAREAVKQWRYEPARRNGEPVAVESTIVVTFRLHGNPLATRPGKVTPPALRHDVPPIYPPELLPQRRIGSVTIEVFVSKTGKVESFEILSATDPAFAEAVRAVVPQWKFGPGRLDGVPTATSLKLTIPFAPPPGP